ncbi:hypothetical protein [Virgisporangium ochraceum]|uniref:Uncharacterized protein n=1 Tax=Virgisporangium ochraceum TaxID=65505 RepID=A0A8J4A3G2_9ACTN|nr:hypothetical protein [Virgisporangium ochraceum]GIJ73170.1 hypothetical protein Voc01_080870 [Virgisporangium ochraceum]
MRRALVVAAVAAALSATVPATAGQASTTDPSTSSSATSSAATPKATPGDVLAGLGTLGDFGNPTAYLAAAGTSWGAPGAFTITYPDGTYAIGASTCLVVDGKVAYLTGKIALSGGPRRTTNAWNRGSYLVVGVEDNGNGGTSETPDRLNFSPGTATDPGCGPNGMATPDFKIVRGNYRVVDGLQA